MISCLKDQISEWHDTEKPVMIQQDNKLKVQKFKIDALHKELS